MRVHILIDGDQGSGKTTVANAISTLFEKHGFTIKTSVERDGIGVDVVRIETTPELLASIRLTNG